MQPDDPAWPTGPALQIYDMNTDEYRPATQADLDWLQTLASSAIRALTILNNAHQMVRDQAPGRG